MVNTVSNLNQALTRMDDWVRSAQEAISTQRAAKVFGRVKKVAGTLLEVEIPLAKIGDLCEICLDGDVEQNILGEVIGFSESSTLISALTSPEGVSLGVRVEALGYKHRICLSNEISGEVLDGMGRQLDGGAGIFFRSPVRERNARPVIGNPVPATQKPRIDEPLLSRIKAVDTMLTIGKGQRIGLFAGAGCGKTTLLASLARGCSADNIVIALIGERGRELKEFLDHELDDALKERTVLVCATSDRSSMERSRAAFTATAIAEGLRDQGKDVLLLVDSLTRFARAQREIGLAAGEPPAKGGFPPSVYTMLPRLVERAGKTTKGSITAIYTLLLEGDSMSDPIADEAKSLLDGHIVLSRKLAESGHYPAIDVLASLSRTMGSVVNERHTVLSSKVRKILSNYQDLELLIKLGEYTKGTDPESDNAIERYDPIMDFFKQDARKFSDLKDALKELFEVAVE